MLEFAWLAGRDVPRATRSSRCHLIYDVLRVEIKVLRVSLNYRADRVISLHGGEP